MNLNAISYGRNEAEGEVASSEQDETIAKSVFALPGTSDLRSTTKNLDDPIFGSDACSSDRSEFINR